MSSRSPIVLVLVGIASVQLGAAVAKNLFDEVSPTTIVWLRLAASAVVLLALARPRLRGRTATDWWVVLAFGATLALMNWAIYQSFARIPLGIAVALELAGPLTLAVAGSRRTRDLAWAGLAVVGVVLLGLDRGEITLPGVAFALLAGATWAAYILLSAQTGRRWPGFEGLSVASAVAAVLMTPVLVVSVHLEDGGSGGHGLDLRIVLLGVLVGLLSSVVPYSCELVALRSLRPATFSVLMSLEPAAAALAGAVVLGEVLSAPQWLAVACVVAASMGATRGAPTIAQPVPD